MTAVLEEARIYPSTASAHAYLSPPSHAGSKKRTRSHSTEKDLPVTKAPRREGEALADLLGRLALQPRNPAAFAKTLHGLVQELSQPLGAMKFGHENLAQALHNIVTAIRGTGASLQAAFGVHALAVAAVRAMQLHRVLMTRLTSNADLRAFLVRLVEMGTQRPMPDLRPFDASLFTWTPETPPPPRQLEETLKKMQAQIATALEMLTNQRRDVRAFFERGITNEALRLLALAIRNIQEMAQLQSMLEQVAKSLEASALAPSLLIRELVTPYYAELQQLVGNADADPSALGKWNCPGVSCSGCDRAVCHVEPGFSSYSLVPPLDFLALRAHHNRVCTECMLRHPFPSGDTGDWLAVFESVETLTGPPLADFVNYYARILCDLAAV